MSVRKNKAGAATAPHLEAIHKLFGGTIDWDFNRVECSAVLGDPGSLSSIQVILDEKAPDGIRVHCSPLKHRDAANDYVRRRLNLPPIVRTAANDNSPQAGYSLPIVDPRDWQGVPIPQRQWLVPDLIPARTVTMLSGEGGTGKSLLALQLMVSMALGLEWLGNEVTRGPCLYFGAEDEAEEIHRRLASIVAHHGRKLDDLHGVRLIPMADRAAILAAPDHRGQIIETVIFPALRAHAKFLRPKLICIDTSADVFGGNEIDRREVRQFVGLLRGLAIEIDCAVLLLSHPSLTGINTGTGLSGSTAWNNSVRSRLYLEAPKGDDDQSTRLLKTMKANYAASGSEIAVRWRDGVYVLDDGPDPVIGNLLNGKADALFVELLKLFTQQGQNVGVATGTSYAPKIMAAHPTAKGYKKADLAAAMQRLLDAGRVEIVTEGPPSRQRSRLVVATTTGDA